MGTNDLIPGREPSLPSKGARYYGMQWVAARLWAVSALTKENYRLSAIPLILLVAVLICSLACQSCRLSVKTRQFHVCCTGYEEQKQCVLWVTFAWEATKVFLNKRKPEHRYVHGVTSSRVLAGPWPLIQSAVERFIILWPQETERRCQLSCTNTFHLLLPATIKHLVGADH